MTEIKGPFPCNTCEKKYATKASLENHLKIHLGLDEKPYKCDVCQAAFGNESNFEVHKRIHMVQETFKCDDCGKELASKLKNCPCMFI